MPITYDASPLEALVFDFTSNTPDIGAGLPIGVLPRGAKIVRAYAYVREGFNAGGNDLLSCGINPASGEFGINIDVSTVGMRELAGFIDSVPLNNGGPLSVDRTIYARYTQTGTAATAGKARIVVEFTRA